MKNKFKVGDWVRRITTDSKNSGTIFQIEKISTDKVIEHKEKFLESSKYRVQEKLCEIWSPKEGEWCWFYNSDSYDSVQLTLGRFYGTTSKELKYTYIDMDRQEYSSECCEPFVYDLPTIIKG